MLNVQAEALLALASVTYHEFPVVALCRTVTVSARYTSASIPKHRCYMQTLESAHATLTRAIFNATHFAPGPIKTR